MDESINEMQQDF
jgi:hypothetical protein